MVKAIQGQGPSIEMTSTSMVRDQSKPVAIEQGPSIFSRISTALSRAFSDVKEWVNRKPKTFDEIEAESMTPAQLAARDESRAQSAQQSRAMRIMYANGLQDHMGSSEVMTAYGVLSGQRKPEPGYRLPNYIILPRNW